MPLQGFMTLRHKKGGGRDECDAMRQLVEWCEMETERVVALTHWSWRETERPPHAPRHVQIVVLDGRRSATECATVDCCGMCDEWMDGREREKRRGVAWRERGKQGGAHGSNMQPLCHGNVVTTLP